MDVRHRCWPPRVTTYCRSCYRGDFGGGDKGKGSPRNIAAGRKSPGAPLVPRLPMQLPSPIREIELMFYSVVGLCYIES